MYDIYKHKKLAHDKDCQIKKQNNESFKSCDQISAVKHFLTHAQF